MPARTEIHDRNGKILKNPDGKEIGFLHGTNRRLINYEEMPPHFVEALIAQEDKRYRSHGAVDFYSMGRVAFRALTRGKLEGGGTLSMQLARNTYQLKKNHEGLLQGIHRKLLETFIAVRIESAEKRDPRALHEPYFLGRIDPRVEMAPRHILTSQLGNSIWGIRPSGRNHSSPHRFSPFRFPKRPGSARLGSREKWWKTK